MHKILTFSLALTGLVLASTTTALAQTPGVGIGTATPNAAAALDISSTGKGVLLPRISQAARDLMAPGSTAAGLLIYNTDTKTLNAWDGTKWAEVLNTATGALSALPVTTSFAYSGVPQTYTVPAGVTRITVTADGASTNASTAQGVGARVQATLTVTPGEVLSVYVGGSGANGSYNGGGAGTTAGTPINGGGATDLRRATLNGTTGDYLSSRNALLVAGGAGGAGAYGITGGNGGTPNGGTGGPGSGGFVPGTGATQSGIGGNNGSYAYGGAPASNNQGGVATPPNLGGGGGGGYYGGGPASANSSVGGIQGGGGGGSSWVMASGTNVSYVAAPAAGNGALTIVTGVAAAAPSLNGANITGVPGTWSVNGTSYYYNGGSVGVGTTSPSALLDVNGTTRLRGLTTAGMVTTDANGNLSSATAASLAQQLTKSGSTISLTNGGSVTDADNQNLSLSGAALSISGGTGVTLPDASATNEIQTISKTGSTISLSNSGGSVTDADGQTLAVSGGNLSISGGNSVALTSLDAQQLTKSGSTISLTNGGSVTDADNQNLSLSGQTLSIVGGNSVTLPTDVDAQTLSLSGSTLSISGGNNVTLPDASATNELQTLSISGSIISLSNSGGSVTVPSSADNLGNHSATQALALNGQALRLSGSTDTNHQLIFDGGVDGPILTGYTGGQLGVRDGSFYGSVLAWNRNGNVGIGTTAPSQKLDVAGSVSPTTVGTEALFRLTRPNNVGVKYPNAAAFSLGTYLGTGTAASSRLDLSLSNGTTFTPDVTVLSALGNGRIGIGTTTPSANLDVVGTTRLRGLTTAGIVTTDVNGNLTSATAASLDAQQLSISGSVISLTNGGSVTVPSSADNLGNHTATQNLNLADKLLVGNGGTTGLAITSTGNVGIGTTVPAGTFDVASGSVRLPGGGGGDTWFNYASSNKNYLRGTTILADLSGNVGIGTASPTALLHVAGAMKIDGANTLEFGAGIAGKEPNAGKIGYQVFSTDGLDIVGAGTGSNRIVKVFAENGTFFNGPVTGVGAFNSSDQRLKQDIRPLTGALALVQRLHGRRYQWNTLGVKRGGQAGAEQVGVIAQELEQVLPELVNTDAQGFKAVNYAQLTPVLIEALKEQQAQIETLQAELAAGKNLLGRQQQQIQTLQTQATAESASLAYRLAALENMLGTKAEAK